MHLHEDTSDLFAAWIKMNIIKLLAYNWIREKREERREKREGRREKREERRERERGRINRIQEREERR